MFIFSVFLQYHWAHPIPALAQRRMRSSEPSQRLYRLFLSPCASIAFAEQIMNSKS